MANNRVRVQGRQLNLPVTDGGINSGDPVQIGAQATGCIVGVALNPKDGNGNCVVDTMGVYNLSVKGVKNAVNTAVNVGDKLFYDAALTPKIDLGGLGTSIFFGFALAAVASGATTTIPVRLAGSN